MPMYLCILNYFMYTIHNCLMYNITLTAFCKTLGKTFTAKMLSIFLTSMLNLNKVMLFNLRFPD